MKRPILSTLATICLVQACLAAIEVPIINPSFELVQPGPSTAPLGWNLTGFHSDLWSIGENPGGFWVPGTVAPEGRFVIAVSGADQKFRPAGLQQQLTETLADTTRYVLSGYVGHPIGFGPSIGTTYTIQLLAGSSVLVQKTATGLEGSLTKFELEFDSTHSLDLGKLLEIQLLSSGAQTVFDDLHLRKTSPNNLELSVTAPDIAREGELINLTLHIFNQGPTDATGVSVSTTLPPGFSLSGGGTSQGSVTNAAGLFISNIGTLTSGATATVTLSGLGPPSSHFLFHTQATRNEVDGTLADNEVDTVVDVLPPCLSARTGLLVMIRGEGSAADELSHSVTANINHYATGIVGKALEFGGSNEVAIANSDDLNTATFSIDAWVYPTAVDGQVDILVDKEKLIVSTFADIQFALAIKGPISPAANSIPLGNLAFFLGGVNGLPNNYAGFVDAKAQIPVNAWTHVALVVTPNSASVYVNGAVTIELGGLAGTLNIVDGPIKLGSRSTDYHIHVEPRDRFNGRIDEFSYYGRALSPAEVKLFYRTGAAGKCHEPFAPQIVKAPVSRRVEAGTQTTFSVAAVGSGPLAYQWKFENTNLPEATNSTLAVIADKRATAGHYSVTVCNAVGCTEPPDLATLAVDPAPAGIRIVNSATISPNNVLLPIQLVGNGDENAVGFTVSYDTNHLSYLDIIPGVDAIGAQIVVNTGQTNQGLIGIILALPTGLGFADKTNELLKIKFGTPLSDTNATTPITFTDALALRTVSGPSGRSVAARWFGGVISVSAVNYEGDASPAPDGDKHLDVSDWVQIGRYVAGLEELAPGPAFQRADCAPLATLGNGLITVSDWVQAGRFAVGLDPKVPVGGSFGSESAAQGDLNHGQPRPQASNGRAVSLEGGDGTIDNVKEVPILLAAMGNENAVAFSVGFNAEVLAFEGVTLGKVASRAALQMNSKYANNGRVGLAMALPTGEAFHDGTSLIASLRFRLRYTPLQSPDLTFIDSPIVREVASSVADALASTWIGGTIPVIPATFKIEQIQVPNGRGIVLSWPVGLVIEDFEFSETLDPAGWTTVPTKPSVIDGLNTVNLPISSGSGFFRIKKH